MPPGIETRLSIRALEIGVALFSRGGELYNRVIEDGISIPLVIVTTARKRIEWICLVYKG